MRYINSYRLTVGRTQCTVNRIYFAIFVVIMAGEGLILKFSGIDYLRDFFMCFAPLVGGLIVLSVAFAEMNCVINANSTLAPGYKFFHSVEGGAEHFRRAVTASNVHSLVLLAFYTGIGLIFYNPQVIFFMLAVVLTAIGWFNISTAMKSAWARVVGLALSGFGVGFFINFDGENTELKYVLPVMIAAAGWYLTAFAVTVLRAKKLWKREG